MSKRPVGAPARADSPTGAPTRGTVEAAREGAGVLADTTAVRGSAFAGFQIVLPIGCPAAAEKVATFLDVSAGRGARARGRAVVLGGAMLGCFVALASAGCAGDSRAQVGDSASATTVAAGALVLRTMTSGGIAGLGGPGTMPDFSLYGDGRAITGGTRPTEYHLTPPALRRLVSAASAAGLATPRTVNNPRIADATYKTITFVTGGRPRTTKVIQEGGPADDPAVKFLRLLVPANWPSTDLTSAPGPYHPERVAVLALAMPGSGQGARPGAHQSSEPVSEPSAAPKWPFKPLNSGSHVGTRVCTTLAGKDAAKVQHVVAGRTLWSDHGRTYRVMLRPLLPDERDCAALNR